MSQSSQSLPMASVSTAFHCRLSILLTDALGLWDWLDDDELSGAALSPTDAVDKVADAAVGIPEAPDNSHSIPVVAEALTVHADVAVAGNTGSGVTTGGARLNKLKAGMLLGGGVLGEGTTDPGPLVRFKASMLFESPWFGKLNSVARRGGENKDATEVVAMVLEGVFGLN